MLFFFFKLCCNARKKDTEYHFLSLIDVKGLFSAGLKCSEFNHQELEISDVMRETQPAIFLSVGMKCLYTWVCYIGQAFQCVRGIGFVDDIYHMHLIVLILSPGKYK